MSDQTNDQLPEYQPAQNSQGEFLARLPMPEEPIALSDNEWPWPHYPKAAARNYRRSVNERFVGWEGDFLEGLLLQGGNIKAAAKHALINSPLAYRRIDTDPTFKKAVEEARRDAFERLEHEAYRRAVIGTKRTKGVYHKGKKIGEEVYTEYSDSLLQMLLRAGDREKYGDKVNHTHRITAIRERVRLLCEQEGLMDQYDQVLEDAFRVAKIRVD